MTRHEPFKDMLILVVEDEFLLADDLSRKLQALGAVVVGAAPTVTGALSLLAKTPDLRAAVLDINLRGTLVFPVAEALIERNIPFLFTSGYDQTVIPARYREVPQVHKPYDLVELTERLGALVG